MAIIVTFAAGVGNTVFGGIVGVDNTVFGGVVGVDNTVFGGVAGVDNTVFGGVAGVGNTVFGSVVNVAVMAHITEGQATVPIIVIADNLLGNITNICRKCFTFSICIIATTAAATAAVTAVTPGTRVAADATAVAAVRAPILVIIPEMTEIIFRTQMQENI